MKLRLGYRCLLLTSLLLVGVAVLIYAVSASDKDNMVTAADGGAKALDEDESDKETLVIAGSGMTLGAMQLMAREFMKNHPDVNVKVLPSIGSSGGIRAVEKDKIDIGLASRPLKPKERNATIVEKPYARTAFVFGVQESNPATCFTLAEIEGLYTQKRVTWPDGTPIRLILRPQSDSASNYLASIHPGLKSASEKAHAIPGVCVTITDQDAAEQIEKTPGAFGTTILCLVKSDKRKIKALSVDGTPPTLANVSTGAYPYVMESSLVYKKDKYKGAVEDFVEFVFSRDGQKILNDNELVTPKPVTTK